MTRRERTMRRERRTLDIFSLARPLLFDLAADIHPGRWPASLPDGARRRLTASGRARNRLSADLGWLFPESPPLREGWWEALAGRPGVWALWNGEALWRVGLRCGASAFRRETARLVLGREVAKLTRAVGGDARRFALRQGALAWRRESLPGLPETGSLAERILRAAGLALGCWLAALPEGLSERARLKLPPAADPDLAAAAGWDAGGREEWLAGVTRVFAASGGESPA